MNKYYETEEELEKGIKNMIAGIGAAAVMGMSGAQAGSGHMHDLVNGFNDKVKIDGVSMTSKFEPSSKGSKHGVGNYHIKVGPYNIKADHSSGFDGGMSHKQKLTVNKDTSDAEKSKWASMASNIHSKFQKLGSKATEKETAFDNSNDMRAKRKYINKQLNKTENIKYDNNGQWSLDKK